MCPVQEDDKIMNKVYPGEFRSSAPLEGLRGSAVHDAMDPETEGEIILSPKPRLNLSKIKRRVHEALGCTTANVLCQSAECPVHQAPRPSPSKRLYVGPLPSHNVIPSIEPPKPPHHDRNLYQVYNDIGQEREIEFTWWARIMDKRCVVQAMNEMETIWREQMLKGYRNDPVYQLAPDSSNTSWGGKMQQ